MSTKHNHCLLQPLPGVCTHQYYLAMISPRLNPFALKLQITSELNAIFDSVKSRAQDQLPDCAIGGGHVSQASCAISQVEKILHAIISKSG